MLQLNALAYHDMDAMLRQAIDALIGTVHYERVADHGPKVREYNESYALFPQ